MDSAAVQIAPVEIALFPPHLSWAHYLVLMRIENPTARASYEIEAARENWASLELGKGFCFVARQKRLSLEGNH